MDNRGECLPGVPKPSRLGAVWLTYWTRPMCWVATLVLVVAAVLVAVLDTSVDHHFYQFVARPTPETPASLLIFDEKGKPQSNVERHHVRSINVQDLQQHPEILRTGTFPNLESVTVRGVIRDFELLALCRLYVLKSLSLPVASDLSEDSFSALEKETTLEFLEIGLPFDFPGNRHPIHKAQTLAWPPNLRSVIFSDLLGIPLSRFLEWKDLPHLKELCVGFGDADAGPSDDAIAVIKQFPQLKTLYLDDSRVESYRSRTQPQPGEFHMINGNQDLTRRVNIVQQKLPSITVRATSVYTGPLRAVGFVFFVTIVMLVPVMMHLAAQFVTTSRALSPKFEIVHLVVAASLMFALVTIAAVFMVQRGCSLLSAVGLASFGLFLMAFNADLYCGFVERHVHRANPGLYLVTYSYLALIQFFIAATASSPWNQFLSGHYPILSAIMILASIWGGFRLLHSKIDLLRTVEEMGFGRLPLSVLDLTGWQTEVQRVQLRSADVGRSRIVRFFWAPSENIDNQPLNLTSRWLWQKAFPPGSLRTIAIFPVFVLLAFLLVVPFRREIPEVYVRAIYAALLSMTSVMTLLPFQMAVHRGKFYAAELLRPVNRREWRNLWFNELARQISVPLFTLIVIEVGVGCLEIPDQMSSLRIAIIILFQVGLSLGIFSAAMIVVTVGSSRIGQMGLFGAFVGVMMAVNASVLTLGTRKDLPLFAIFPDAGISITVVTYVVSVIVFWIAWRRWMTWELGREI